MRVNYLILLTVLGLWGCASGATEPVAAPREEIKVFYYVGAEAVNLKSSPDYNSSDAGALSLNEQVEKLKLGPAGWFMVRTQDGRQGWINEKYLKVSPVSEFFVRRRGVRLLTEPQEQSTIVARLKTNDQVKLVEQNPQGWAQITVANSGKTGWLKIADLAVEPVVIRPVRRRPAKAAKGPVGEPAGEVAGTEKAGEPPALSLTPPSAEAAPPPAKQPSPKPKARPEMFEPF
jgi:SH3-like domain-containing protein